MSFKPYPKYKESGVEWLGRVPEHWEVVRLGYLASRIGSGKTPSGGADNYCQQGVLFLRSQNIYDEGLRLEDVVYITQATDERMPTSRVLPGDILLNITGASLGRTCVVPDDFEAANVNQHVCVIRLRDTSLRAFVSLLLKSAGAKSQLDYIQNGAAREGLNFSMVSSILCPLPSREERDRIAAFLDHETAKIDALVAEQQRLIELLQEKRQAVISHAVTKGLNPDAPMKDSGIEWLGEVPEHWSVVPFASSTHFQEGPGIMAVDFREEGVPLLRLAGAQGRWASLDGCNYLDPNKVTVRWEHFRLREGDLLISGSASMGTVCEVGPETAGAIPYTGLIRLSCREDRIRRDFLRHAVVSSMFVTQLDRLRAGATIQHFGPTHLRAVKIALPPLKEQEAVCRQLEAVLDSFDSLVSSAEAGITLLQERRSALISAAVTGQIDVRGFAGTEAA